MADIVKSYHDEYISSMNNWEFLKNSYFGTGGFANGGYIEKYDKESQQKYLGRKKNAYYLNYCATVIDTYNAHLFKKAIVRKSDNPYYKRFIENCNGANKNIDTFMKGAFLYAQIFGYSFVVIDKPDIEVKTRLEEFEENALPYAYILPPQSVIDWSIDAKGEFNWVKVVEDVPRDANNFLDSKDMQTFYRVWTKEEFYLFNEKEELVEKGEHNLGVVPFILLQNKKGTLGSIVGKSEINDIAKISKRLYNLCSELDDLLRSQTFAILTYPALDAKDLSDVELGTDRILTYDPSSSFAPAFISPSADATKAYETRIDTLIKEIYRLARLSFKGGVTPSGIALAFEFEKTNQALCDKALNLQQAEIKIAKIVSRWQDSEFDGEIQYPLDFSLADIESELKLALDTINLNLSDRFNKEYKKSVMRKLMPRLPESVKIIIDKEIQEVSQETTPLPTQ
jgi:hypothetical protein